MYTLRYHNSIYTFPIFTTDCNNVPLLLVTGRMEATHLLELYECYADVNNNHPTSYTDNHPDILERRIHQSPDLEVVSWNHGDLQYYVGLNTGYALQNAYYNARVAFGEALQPAGWNRLDPWRRYDFATELDKLGMPLIPEPSEFHNGVYHLPFESLEKLQHVVHRNNVYALSLYAYSYIINAVLMRNYHNLAPSGYMRGSPTFVGAERRWRRLHGFPVLDRSEDDQSAAGELSDLNNQADSELNRYNTDFDMLAEEQEDSADALAAAAPPDTNSSMETEEPAPADSFNSASWQEGALRSTFNREGLISFALANVELLRSLRERRDDHAPFSNMSNAGSPPVVPSSIPELDLYDLIERLEAIADPRGSVELMERGRRGRVDQPDWEWPTDPAPANAPAMGSPRWPTNTQQHTPPLNWEDYWSTMSGEGFTHDQLNVGGSLVDHVIFTHPSVTN